MSTPHPDGPGGIFDPSTKHEGEKPGAIIVTGVEDAVLRALETARGPRGTRVRLMPGASRYSSHKTTAPASYLEGVAAARRAVFAANSLVERWVQGARGEGASWEDLADVLGVMSDPYFTSACRGELAWREYVRVNHTDRDLTYAEAQWRCTSCWQHVRDHGPGWHGGDPRKTEAGHADNCARHAVEVSAWLVAHSEPEPSTATG